MPNPSLDATALAELAALFETAEQRLKEAELLNLELSIPALNELRYVAYHLVRALNDGGSSTGELHRARNHARRAIYDATEACLLTLLEQAYSYREAFRRCDGVLATLPEYPAILDELRAIQQRLLANRANDDAYLARDRYYAESLADLERLRALVRTLEHAEPILRASTRRQAMRWWTGIVVVLGVFALSAALALTWLLLGGPWNAP